MLEIVTDIKEVRGTAEQIDLLEELAETVEETSLCAFGRTAPNPAISILRYFREETIMSKKKRYGGLCMTCANDPYCKLPRSYSLPVEQCEEFTSYGAQKIKKSKKQQSETENMKEVSISAIKLAREMGLCSNCENRDTCTLKKARKVVQYCEEYK